jgi:hypothetical protein
MMIMTTLSEPSKISNKKLSSAAYANTIFFTIPGCLLLALIGFIAVTDTLEINKRRERDLKPFFHRKSLPLLS